MALRLRQIVASRATGALFMVTLLSAAISSFAQNAGFDLSLHANDHATAGDIRLPSYPGASVYKEPDNDAAFDMGFSSHFRLMVAKYMTNDSSAKVLDFYRKPLSRYGEVLECNDGKPVGTLKTTRSELTCSDEHGGRSHASASSDSDHDLRAGTPQQFRVPSADRNFSDRPLE